MTILIETAPPDLEVLPAGGLADPMPRSLEPTVLPQRLGPVPAQQRRAVGEVSRDDVLVASGAAMSALATTLLIFGRLTPLSGRLGFVVVLFLVFIAIYAFLVSVDNDVPAVIDKVMGALMTSAALVSFAALASVVVFVLWRGRAALVKVNTYTSDMSTAGPLDPLDKGGVAHAIVGTLVIIALALVLVVPLGLACAVFLNESAGRATGLVRTVVTAMTALPSIVAGLFVFAAWVLVLGYERSGLAASLAVSIMMLPIIIRSADIVLRLVPGSLREAAAATGASHWRSVWHVVLPTARSGLANSVILGVARGVGETAPVLLVSGITANLNFDPRENAMMSLPLAVFEFVKSPQQELVQRGFATAAVLMALVLLLFTLARIVGGRPAGHLSGRRTRRASARSARDLERIDARSVAVVDHTVGVHHVEVHDAEASS